MTVLHSFKGKFFAAQRAELTVHDAQGEIIVSVPLPLGVTDAKAYRYLLDVGEVQLGKGVTFVPAKSAVGVQSTGKGSHESAANPDYRPTSATQNEREMRVLLRRMHTATNRIEARERAFANVERMPKPADNPVIEEEPKKEPGKPAKAADAPKPADVKEGDGAQ